MKRPFGKFAYGDGPRLGCWWDDTTRIPAFPRLESSSHCDVAIIGGGFTGLVAALELARAGISVCLLEAERIGWGASGRNGGFCCLGGGMAGDARLDRRFGREGRIEYRRTEQAAVQFVDDLIDDLRLDVDRHSDGETILAHRSKDVASLKAHADALQDNYGVGHEFHDASSLADHGMDGPFHAALTIKAGFALNPLKYLHGLVEAAMTAGAKIYEGSPVEALERKGAGWALQIDGKVLSTDQVILATNGYSSETLPRWLGGRYLPSQSNVIVTRPLSEAELVLAGWTTSQMAYDTRNLLHYFRLMPDWRFLFGMRGGLLTGRAAEAHARRNVRRDFDQMFPAWRHVETPHSWSGMVCLARDMLPFVGAIPDHDGLWAGMCYHGNGVAMGSYSGAILAQMVQGKRPDMLYPAAIRTPLRRFELGRYRRAMMPFTYGAFMLVDR
jgi:glycine/D-amino acid oxidase-like deaminating enzyme